MGQYLNSDQLKGPCKIWAAVNSLRFSSNQANAIPQPAPNLHHISQPSFWAISWHLSTKPIRSPRTQWDRCSQSCIGLQAAAQSWIIPKDPSGLPSVLFLLEPPLTPLTPQGASGLPALCFKGPACTPSPRLASVCSTTKWSNIVLLFLDTWCLAQCRCSTNTC